MNSTFLFLAVSILFASSAQLLVKKGALLLGKLEFSLENIFGVILHILKNFYIMSGLFCLGLSFLLWIFIVSKKQLNIVYPISSSLTIVLVVIFSWFLFSENLSLWQISGILLVILGIFLLSFKTAF